MKVGIFGSGYVGLVAAACLAEAGHDVDCCDPNSDLISELNQGIVKIHEPGLTDLVQSHQKTGRLRFSKDEKRTLTHKNVIVVAVGTPSGKDGVPELDAVHQVLTQIWAHLENPCVVIIKSTVPLGTLRRLQNKTDEELRRQGKDFPVALVSSPEFLSQGTAVQDFLQPRRIVIGTTDLSVKPILEDFYQQQIRNGVPLFWMSPESAELAKYSANAMLALRVSFMNELSRLADKVGADIQDVKNVLGTDERIGPLFLEAGLGFGGSCLPKDVQALIHLGQSLHQEVGILKEIGESNRHQRDYFFNKILHQFNGDLKGKKLGLWGLSFKAGTGDLRDSPSLALIEKLCQVGASVSAYDPVVSLHSGAEKISNLCELAASALAATAGKDALIIATAWPEFYNIELQDLKASLKTPVIFDGRNQLDTKKLKTAGFTYISIGRAADE